MTHSTTTDVPPPAGEGAVVADVAAFVVVVADVDRGVGIRARDALDVIETRRGYRSRWQQRPAAAPAACHPVLMDPLPPAPEDIPDIPEASNIPFGQPEAGNIPWGPPPPPPPTVGTRATGINIPAGRRNSSIAETTVNHEYRYATTGLIIGGLVTLSGVAMILLNISGAIDLTIHIKDNEVKINTAVVGIVVAFVGTAIIFFTKPKISFAKQP